MFLHGYVLVENKGGQWLAIVTQNEAPRNSRGALLIAIA
jgi:hypothetical protein